jgi:3'-phosphoadenosine 5'-phosphosulfate sulfotransferase (PAPS reductase)/FAD synthetase
VLLHLVRRLYPDVKAVFVNTTMEYPSICRFVRQMRDDGADIDIIMPKMKPKRIWQKWGFPLISKETANKIYRIRYNPDSAAAEKWMRNTGLYKLPLKWRWLLDEKFCCADNCCRKLKKEPAERYERKTGRYPILGILASESRLRTHEWMRHGGCNVLDGVRKKSKPLSIWTDKDIWDYIHKYNLKYADIYDKGIGQTGCACCGFSISYEDTCKFEVLYELYPKLYRHVLGFTNNGVTFREALRKVLDKLGRKLPDERDPKIFD